MTIDAFDHLPDEKKKELLLQCCGSTEWVNKMLGIFPVEDLVDLLECAEEKWNECSEDGWMEAFEHHPKIGNVNSLQQAAGAKALASKEQSGIEGAGDETLQQLAKGNENYLQKFGFIFIICATGRSADEMLKDLTQRLGNSKEAEIKTAAAEQLKITKLRLEKLFDINESSKYYEL
jgi:2-oxo-4-hydroxy-4-carboxy-5-ureidoimidazoline decarboxylase